MSFLNKIFTGQQFSNGKLFNVTGSDWTKLQQITFSSLIVSITSNSVAKLVSKKTSIYTVKTSKLPFPRLLQKLGCQRKWILKTFLIANFDKVSDFESRNSLRVKFKLSFAINVRFWNNCFNSSSDFIDNVFSYNTDFDENFAFGQTNFGAFYNEKTTNLAVLCFLLQNESEKNTGLANSFWIKKKWYDCVRQPTFSQLDSFWMRKITTCHTWKEYFQNISRFSFTNQILRKTLFSES